MFIKDGNFYSGESDESIQAYGFDWDVYYEQADNTITSRIV